MPLNAAIQASLSVPRMATYVAATAANPALPGAVALYSWNAEIAAAFLHPLHICEVVIRNAVADALENIYGPNWPWDNGFQLSLPLQVGRLYPRDELLKKAQKIAARPHPSTGKVVAELAFAFWEFMFTQRHDPTIWSSQGALVIPHAPVGAQYFQIRAAIHSRLGVIRKLRNRIAHHEPIFGRNLSGDLQMIEEVVRFRCPDTAAWMMQHQRVQALLHQRPL